MRILFFLNLIFVFDISLAATDPLVGSRIRETVPTPVPGIVLQARPSQSVPRDEGEEDATSSSTLTLPGLSTAPTVDICTKKLDRCQKAVSFSYHCDQGRQDVSHECMQNQLYKNCKTLCTVKSEYACAGDEIKSFSHQQQQCPRTSNAAYESLPKGESFPPVQSFEDLSPTTPPVAAVAAATEPTTKFPDNVPMPPQRPKDLGVDSVSIGTTSPSSVPVNPKMAAPLADRIQAGDEPSLAETKVHPQRKSVSFYTPDEADDSSSKNDIRFSQSGSSVSSSATSFPSSSTLGTASANGGEVASARWPSSGGAAVNTIGSSGTTESVSGHSTNDPSGAASSETELPQARSASVSPQVSPASRSLQVTSGASLQGTSSSAQKQNNTLPGFRQEYHQYSGHHGGGRSSVSAVYQRPSGVVKPSQSSSSRALKKTSSLDSLFARLQGKVIRGSSSASARNVASQEKNKEIGSGIHTVFEQVVHRANQIQLDHNGMIRNP